MIEEPSMRTTINVDDHLFEELMRRTGARTKTAAVRTALHEYIRLKRKEDLLALRGKVDILDNWRELRQLEIQEMKDTWGDD
jgi:Arc/MetJ family transcription regulator